MKMHWITEWLLAFGVNRKCNEEWKYFLLLKPRWLRAFLCKNICFFGFYFYVTLVYGKSDHFADMELELECRIFQPSMSPGYIITGMQSDY